MYISENTAANYYSQRGYYTNTIIYYKYSSNVTSSPAPYSLVLDLHSQWCCCGLVMYWPSKMSDVGLFRRRWSALFPDCKRIWFPPPSCCHVTSYLQLTEPF